MRIGVDARNLAEKRTGIVSYIYNMLSELQKIDDRNSYFLFSHKDFNFPLANKNWHKIIGYGLTTRISKVWLQTQLGELANNENLDIFWAPANLLPRNLTKNIKTLLTVHDLIYIFHPDGMETKNIIANKLFQQKSILKADKIIAVSQATAGDLGKVFPGCSSKLTVLGNGINLDFYRPQNDIQINDILVKYGVDSDYILTVSSHLSPRRNLSSIVKVYANLVNRYNTGLKLIVIGDKICKNNELYKLIKDLKLDKQIFFTGFVPDDDLVALYSGARVFLYISLYEGFGLPILEAMACGCPVITSNISSMPEVAGDAAILVDCRNIGEISQAVLDITNNDAVRSSLIAKGLDRVKQFNWADRSYRLLNMFEDLTKR